MEFGRLRDEGLSDLLSGGQYGIGESHPCRSIHDLYIYIYI